MIEESIRKLSKLGTVSIIYSDSTNKFYVSVSGIEVKSNGFLKGVCEHRNTIEESVSAYMEAIKDQTLVKDAYTDCRKEITIL
jgi:predicted P-loop ATPase/GTPase